MIFSFQAPKERNIVARGKTPGKRIIKKALKGRYTIRGRCPHRSHYRIRNLKNTIVAAFLKYDNK
jgi:hypothetical protein